MIATCPYCMETFKTAGTLAFQVSGENTDQRIECPSCKRHGSGQVIDGRMSLRPAEESGDSAEQRRLLAQLYG